MKKIPLIINVFLVSIFLYGLVNMICADYSNYTERTEITKLAQKANTRDVSYISKENKIENIEILSNSQNLHSSYKLNYNPSKQSATQTPQKLSKYESLFKENNDLYGWITIENTTINYPVMQTIGNQNFYLKKNWEKNESKYGLPFLDENVNSKSNNIIIYGHNMKDNLMFGELTKYTDYDFYNSHKYIKFDTLYEEATYEIISISKTVAYNTWKEVEQSSYYFYSHINMSSEEEFNEYVNQAKKNAYFDTGVSAKYGDNLITLSTCDYWAKNARLLVIAKRIK